MNEQDGWKRSGENRANRAHWFQGDTALCKLKPKDARTFFDAEQDYPRCPVCDWKRRAPIRRMG